MNGGLFECLDYKTKEKEERKYIDGFTATKGKQPIVPNFLFFSEIQKKDISKFYGKENKTYEVEGLIDLLKSYNFTIDENEADDIEVALDPELLGSIFENLLASYNPETATTARKATGSFYTPREIVNYMTNESLKQYFITNLKTDSSSQTDTELEKKLDSLIKSNNSENPFDPQTSQKIIKLIDELRVVDPAVGSGAFPMAVLNKLVFILAKLDPNNKFWEQTQLDGTKNIPDPKSRKVAVESIKKKFQEKNADYGRKLYLIEKCIYGVDIQQIAVEIAKLRFFISLLVDEKIEWDKPENNYGIEPLPNLDFKLMQGNSLISSFAGIDFNAPEKPTESLLFDADEPYQLLIKEFEELKNEYQNESEKTKKDLLREKIEKTIYKIVEDKISPKLRGIEKKYANVPESTQRDKAIINEKQQLAKRLGFNDIVQIEKDLKAFTEGRKPKDFFLWNVYFAEVFNQKDGFDIVIGNPPYVDIKSLPKEKVRQFFKNYKTTEKRINLYSIFIERGYELINMEGVLTYINPNSLLVNESYRKIRELIIEDTQKIIKLPDSVFKMATVETIILILSKGGNENTFIKAKFFKSNDAINFNTIKFQRFEREIWKQDVYTIFNIFTDAETLKIISKIEIGTQPLIHLVDFSLGITPYDKYKGHSEKLIKNREFHSKHKISNESVPLISGKNIHHFFVSNEINEYLRYGSWLGAPRESRFFDSSKIIVRQILEGSKLGIIAAYSEKPRYFTQIGFSLVSKDKSNTSLKFLTAILNSTLLSFYHKAKYLDIEKITFAKILIVNCKQLPIKTISLIVQKTFETLVDTIIAKKKAGEDTTIEEREIDIMVYKLYELTYEEVKIVDPDFALTEREYEDFKQE
ncbi:MAG: TaqI-like C-terminal specificity domain-containing protein [Candidatus Cloacimonadales bacterium]|nr:TaqI-like C-terminal specificity domain-containing protein [Candidatus Cloacimonadales bacterium]